MCITLISFDKCELNSQNGSTGHTGGGHFIRTVHVLNHGHFTDIVSALAIQINYLDMWKNIENNTTEIVYDNKNLHITELEYTWQVFIYTIILCCPCYMPKYVPKLEGIMHDPYVF